MLMDKYLVCTDLDRTLIPTGTQPESAGARSYFSQLVASEQVVLAYVSGRDRNLVAQAIKSYQLPTPDYVIGDVGTNIYDISDKAWRESSGWHDVISQDWNGYSRIELCNLLKDIGELRLQEHRKQNRYKCSYYFPLHIERVKVEKTIQQKLDEKQIRASLIWSVDEPASIGLLDILPESASKLHAIEFLRGHLHIPLNKTIFAGDSGNDLAVMASPIPSVLVANAAADVRLEAEKAAGDSGFADALYIANGNYQGMNGNYSAGILEGINHFYPELAGSIKMSH